MQCFRAFGSGSALLNKEKSKVSTINENAASVLIAAYVSITYPSFSMYSLSVQEVISGWLMYQPPTLAR